MKINCLLPNCYESLLGKQVVSQVTVPRETGMLISKCTNDTIQFFTHDGHSRLLIPTRWIKVRPIRLTSFRFYVNDRPYEAGFIADLEQIPLRDYLDYLSSLMVHASTREACILVINDGYDYTYSSAL